MFENVDGRTDDGRTDDGVTGILIAHLRAFGSGELIITHRYFSLIKSMILHVPYMALYRFKLLK